MTNTETTAAKIITIHGVLAGACRGKAKTAVMLYHGSLDGSEPLCKGLKHELCDYTLESPPEPTCAKCKSKVAKLLTQGYTIVTER